MTDFARATLIRAVRTAAQAALAVIGAGAFDVVSADWQAIASVSAGAAVVSVLTSLATGLPEVE
jgi:dihydroorotate dehydrogenase